MRCDGLFDAAKVLYYLSTFSFMCVCVCVCVRAFVCISTAGDNNMIVRVVLIPVDLFVFAGGSRAAE